MLSMISHHAMLLNWSSMALTQPRHQSSVALKRRLAWSEQGVNFASFGQPAAVAPFGSQPPAAKMVKEEPGCAPSKKAKAAPKPKPVSEGMVC